MPAGQRQLEPSYRRPSDRVLLERLRTGQDTAATELYGRYARRLLALAKARCSPSLSRTLDPEDIVQSVFRRFFQRAQRGDYDVPEGEDLWKLFLVIALNRIRSAHTWARSLKRRLPAGALRGHWSEGRDLARRTPRSYLRLAIQETLNGLPEPHLAVVQLRIAGHAIADIAARLRRSQRTVERLLQEARGWLRTVCEEVL